VETQDTSEIERSTALARRARLGDYDESMIGTNPLIVDILLITGRSNIGTTRAQQSFPHRRRFGQTPQSLRDCRRLRRCRVSRNSRSHALRMWKAPHHRLRSSHPELSESTRSRHTRGRRHAQSPVSAQATGADRTVDAVRLPQRALQ
jgi:hypothetical protein